MSCSKEVRFPGSWNGGHREVLKQPVDESYVSFDEIVKWAKECGICDEITLKKYYDVIRPYYCLRSLFPVFPKTDLCRNVFKAELQFFLCLYIVDDQLEKDEVTLEETEKIVNAYDELEEKIDKTFPKFPNIKELKAYFALLKDEKLISCATNFMDAVNRCTSVVLQHSNASEDAVFDYRKRQSNAAAIFLQGVASEKRASPKDTENKVLWRRIFGGAAFIFMLFMEVSSNALGKTKPIISTITDLYLLNSFACIAINDLYSYHRETEETITCENMVRFWLQRNEVASVPEASDKTASIIEAIHKYMYEIIQETKAKYPNSPELHTLMDYIGYATFGWYILHENANDRYKDSPWRLRYVELEESELEAWAADKQSYGCEVVKQFISRFNEEAKILNDSLSGIISIRGRFT